MASHDLSVFLEEFGATVNLTLPGIVSEKERLLLKLLMEGMSVTEISQYRNRSAKTISHQKKQLYEKLGIQSDITFWRDIFFQYHPQVVTATGNTNKFYIPDNRCHHIVTPEAISLALENHEFKPWIQPVFCAQTGVLTGCEVLVRWEHPQTGIIPPDQFIPLAESSGLIVIMTRQLMKQTADILLPVKHLLPDNFHIGINVSAGCFLAAGFEKECLNLVKKLGNDKIKLVLELTERNPIPVTPEARAILIAFISTTLPLRWMTLVLVMQPIVICRRFRSILLKLTSRLCKWRVLTKSPAILWTILSNWRVSPV